MIINIYFS